MPSKSPTKVPATAPTNPPTTEYITHHPARGQHLNLVLPLKHLLIYLSQSPTPRRHASARICPHLPLFIPPTQNNNWCLLANRIKSNQSNSRPSFTHPIHHSLHRSIASHSIGFIRIFHPKALLNPTKAQEVLISPLHCHPLPQVSKDYKTCPSPQQTHYTHGIPKSYISSSLITKRVTPQPTVLDHFQGHKPAEHRRTHLSHKRNSRFPSHTPSFNASTL